MNKEIMLITSYFPYSHSEAFLETEVQYWSQVKDVQLTVFPTELSVYKREIPENISINNFLIDKQKNKILYLLKSLVHVKFYKELLTNVIQNPKRLKYAISSFIKYLWIKDKLEVFLANKNTENMIFYTYWHTEVTYALQSLKKKYTFVLLTRTHGFDLYEERKVHQYMPFRRQFLKNIDKIYTIAWNAEKYLMCTYGFDAKIIETSRLGVNEHNISTTSNVSETYHIVSCSSLIQVKRLDKLIRALEQLSFIKKEIEIVWTHIGTGPMEDSLKTYAETHLAPLSNVSYCFFGEVDNDSVFKFYKNNKVDVFINVSEYEGVPVSIMEAMSCHIPVIAPDIGGISEILDKNRGILLSSIAEVEEISTALSDVSYFKEISIRTNAYKAYNERYNAEKNYNQFIHSVLDLENRA